MSTCPVCGERKHIPIFSSTNRHGRHLQMPYTTFSVVVCENCGLMGPADIVTDSHYYQTYYPQGYHGTEQSKSVIVRVWEQVANRLIRKKIKTILCFFGEVTNCIRLLDIGCGPGYFLSHLDKTKFEPHGLEPVGEAVESAKKKGLDVTQGDVLVTPLGVAKYDVVTLWHVLEHLERPELALHRIHAALDELGIVVIATPNTRSLACKMGREYWFHLDSPRHLLLFNKDNLAQLLDKTGFEMIHFSYLPFDFPLDLFWSLMRNWRLWPVLAFYPLSKLFDRENMLVIARKRFS